MIILFELYKEIELKKTLMNSLLPACLLGLFSLPVIAVETSDSSALLKNKYTSQVPRSAWLNKPAKLDWVLALSAQQADNDKFYDLSLAVPLFEDFNYINDLNLLFINRIVFARLDYDYRTYDNDDSDYFAYENAVRMNVPINENFHLFFEGAVDTGRLLFGQILDINTDNSRRYDDYQLDYSGALGMGYSHAQWGVNFVVRHRKIHFDRTYSKTLYGLEFVYGF